MPDQNGGKSKYYKILVTSFLCWDRRPDIESSGGPICYRRAGFFFKICDKKTQFLEDGFAATRLADINLLMPLARNDERFMRAALKQARRALGQTSPNPVVGAVLVLRIRIVAKGHHPRAEP